MKYRGERANRKRRFFVLGDSDASSQKNCRQKSGHPETRSFIV